MMFYWGKLLMHVVHDDYEDDDDDEASDAAAFFVAFFLHLIKALEELLEPACLPANQIPLGWKASK